MGLPLSSISEPETFTGGFANANVIPIIYSIKIESVFMVMDLIAI
jgi:hypothetical protein